MNTTQHPLATSGMDNPGCRRFWRAIRRLGAHAWLLAGMIAALAMPAAASAQASLLRCKTTSQPEKLVFQVPKTLTMDRHWAPGTVIGTYYASPTGSGDFTWTCDPGGAQGEVVSALDILVSDLGGGEPGGTLRIPNTNLGIRFEGAAASRNGSGGKLLKNTRNFRTVRMQPGATTREQVYSGQPLALQLVAMGPVASGTVIPGGVIGSIQASAIEDTSRPGAALKFYDIELSNPLDIILQGCTVGNASVMLGTQNLVGGLGAATPAVDFAIQLTNCPTGTPIYFRIDPNTSIVPPLSGAGPGSSSSLMTLDGSSTATGVGIQLLNSSGAGLPLATNIALTSGLSTPDTAIPLKARYMQMAPSMTPGTANGSATVTLTYQ